MDEKIQQLADLHPDQLAQMIARQQEKLSVAQEELQVSLRAVESRKADVQAETHLLTQLELAQRLQQQRHAAIERMRVDAQILAQATDENVRLFGLALQLALEIDAVHNYLADSVQPQVKSHYHWYAELRMMIGGTDLDEMPGSIKVAISPTSYYLLFDDYDQQDLIAALYRDYQPEDTKLRPNTTLAALEIPSEESDPRPRFVVFTYHFMDAPADAANPEPFTPPQEVVEQLLPLVTAVLRGGSIWFGNSHVGVIQIR